MPTDFASLRERFELSLSELQRAGIVAAQQVGEDYAYALEKLAGILQHKGALRALVAVHDERKRFTGSKAIPRQSSGQGAPPELQILQDHFIATLQETNAVHALQLADLCAGYLKNLALLEEEYADWPHVVEQLRAERDRVLDLKTVRGALSDLAAAAAAGPLTSPFSIEPIEDFVFKEVKLSRPTDEPPDTVMGYRIEGSLGLSESETAANLTLTESAKSSSFTSRGNTKYLLRTTISCRNESIDPGSLLVFEYFSRSLTSGEHQRERVEHIPLPGIERGDSLTITGRGISLYKYESESKSRYGTTRTLQGKEFYGFIVNVYGSDEAVVLQRFYPQSLERELSPAPMPSM